MNIFSREQVVHVVDEVGRDPLRPLRSVVERRTAERMEQLTEFGMDIGIATIHKEVLLEHVHELAEARHRISAVLQQPHKKLSI